MSYDAIVIGGGISGAATAYHLAASGKNVAILERNSPGAHASGFAFGWVSASFDAAPGASAFERLRAASVAIHRELAATLGDITADGYFHREKAGLALAFDETEAAELRATGRASFRRATWDSGRQDVRWLAYGELSHIEARVSPAVIGGLLRDELEYDGLVVTDDLAMGAIAKHRTQAAAAVEALGAGCDLLLLCEPDPAAQAAVIEGLIHAVEDGSLPEWRVEEALGRQRRARERFLRGDDGWRPPAEGRLREIVGCAEHQDIGGSMREFL